MKKVVSILFLILISTQVYTQDKKILEKPRVDRNVELLSIVFRLAEKPEYSSKHFKLYVDRIENYFEKYKSHELIQYTKSDISKKVGYDGVMKMAVFLDDNLNLRKGVVDGSLDERWKKEDVTKFVSLLKKFYKDSNFEIFYKDNKDLYAHAEKQFLPIYESLDIDWYKKFYGKEPNETFKIVNGLGNGGNNYGAAINYTTGERDVYSIMGLWSFDSIGMPRYEMNGYFPILVHEFNHSFVNYLTDKNEGLLKESGHKIFAVVGDGMRKQAYTEWKTVLNEALVRAAVVKYMKDHKYDQRAIENEENMQILRGFVWIKELVGELDKYDTQRDIYPTLESYMPKLVEAYVGYTKLVEEYETKRPQIISINEFANGDTNVNSSIKTITMNFDKPLLGKGFSVYTGSKGTQAFPKIVKMNYENDNKSVVMQVELEKNKEYQFIMRGIHFKTPDGIVMKDYEVNFTTAKE